jgi:prophage antirepressor-like protein
MDLLPFDFESHAVRVVMADGVPTFVAADACRALVITAYRDAISRLDETERVSVVVGTRGGPQTMTAVTEGGLYALIFRSRKPAAKRFRRWVTSEVLPAIRRDGAYALAPDELAPKRTYFASLPPAPRAQAEARAEALAQVEARIAEGLGVDAAIREVAAARGIGCRTLYNWRGRAWMVARRDWPAAMAPRHRAAPRRALKGCHPEVSRLFLDLAAGGARITDCYRRTVEVARAEGWMPIPSERTLRRAAAKALLPVQA